MYEYFHSTHLKKKVIGIPDVRNSAPTTDHKMKIGPNRYVHVVIQAVAMERVARVSVVVCRTSHWL